MKETNIQQLIRIEASKHGFRLWRNHVGGLYDGDGRFHKFGLCKGSSDLIGISPDGRFVAIEVKMPGEKPTKEQVIFIQYVQSMGGIAGVADSVDSFLKIIVDE